MPTFKAEGDRRGGEKEPITGEALQQQAKMAPCRGNQRAGPSATGTKGGVRRGGDQANKQPEGRGQVAEEDNRGGGSAKAKQAGGRQNVAAPKMAPGIAAMQASTQHGGHTSVPDKESTATFFMAKRERSPPTPRINTQPQIRGDSGEGPQAMKGGMRGRTKLGSPWLCIRSKSLPPHLGLEEFKLKDGSDYRQKQSYDNLGTNDLQQDSQKATHPPITQSDKKSENDLKQNPTTKRGKKFKRPGHTVQYREVQKKGKQAHWTVSTRAMKPQSFKTSAVAPSSAKISQSPETNLHRVSSTMYSRPKYIVVKGVKRSSRKRGASLASLHCSSSPICTWNNTPGSGCARRARAKLFSTDTDINETLLLYRDGLKSRQNHKKTCGQAWIATANMKTYRGIRPSEGSLLLREGINPSDMLGEGVM